MADKNVKKKKRTKAEKEKLITQIVCIVMSVLMVGGVLVGAIYYLI